MARLSSVTALLGLPMTAALCYLFGLKGAVASLGVNAAITWVFYYFALEKECLKWTALWFTPVFFANCQSY